MFEGRLESEGGNHEEVNCVFPSAWALSLKLCQQPGKGVRFPFGERSGRDQGWRNSQDFCSKWESGRKQCFLKPARHLWESPAGLLKTIDFWVPIPDLGSQNLQQGDEEAGVFQVPRVILMGRQVKRHLLRTFPWFWVKEGESNVSAAQPSGGKPPAPLHLGFFPPEKSSQPGR